MSALEDYGVGGGAGVRRGRLGRGLGLRFGFGLELGSGNYNELHHRVVHHVIELGSGLGFQL